MRRGFRGFFKKGENDRKKIDQDAGVTLVTPTRRVQTMEDQFGSSYTAKELVSTTGVSMPVSIARMVQEVNISIPSPVIVKDKDKEWENIRERVKADEELSKRLHVEKRNKYIKRYSFDELKELFETTMKNVNTFVPMETEDRGRASELAARSSQAIIIDSAKVGRSKRAAEAELDHEVPVEEVYVEALQIKYPIIDWEVYIEESRKYWKIIKVGIWLEKDSVQQNLLMDKRKSIMVELERLLVEQHSEMEISSRKSSTSKTDQDISV
ncbi:hypothetical protein Tco_0807481 [Tanacetum coccineum]